MAKFLIIAGALLLVSGLLLHYVPWTFNWFGRLPGDVRIDTENGKVFIPITSMLLVSVIVTILVNLFRR